MYFVFSTMAGKKRKGTYTSLSLPTELMEEIEERIKGSEYRGITEFTKVAIREKLDNFIISEELSDFERLIYKDLLRQKRLEALKETMSFRNHREQYEKLNNIHQKNSERTNGQNYMTYVSTAGESQKNSDKLTATWIDALHKRDVQEKKVIKDTKKKNKLKV